MALLGLEVIGQNAPILGAAKFAAYPRKPFTARLLIGAITKSPHLARNWPKRGNTVRT
jgi:hypothetical protein